MKKSFFAFLLLSIGAMCMNDLLAYTNEVRQSGNSYIWRTDNVDRGTLTDLVTAINNTIWQSTGTGREIHILVGGSLTSTVLLPPDVKVYFHNNTFTTTHSGYAVHAKKVANVQMYDMILNAPDNFYVFRFSGCNNAVLSGIRIIGGGIGMRLESSDASDPWNFTYYNLTVKNCTFENCLSHGLETYSVDGFNIDNIVAKNLGECGVCLNYSRNGTVGTVDAYRCSKNGGYAGLRFCNTCSNVKAKMLYARECGRGFFVLSGSYDCHLENCEIVDCVDYWGEGRGIWLENVVNCSVEAGCCNTGKTVTGTNSYANTDTICFGSFNGTFGISPQHSGKAVATNGFGTTNGTKIVQWSNTGDNAQKFIITPVEGEWHRITPVIATGQAWDITGASTANSAYLQTWAYYGTTNQQFKFKHTAFGGWNMIARNSGKCLDVQYGSTADGARIIQYDCSGGTNQSFNLSQLKNASLSPGLSQDNDLPADRVVVTNPVHDKVIKLSLSLPEKSNVKTILYSMQGQIVFVKDLGCFDQGSSQCAIDLDNSIAGLYLLRVETESGNVNVNILVK